MKMIATSNFVNQVHNGTVNNNNSITNVDEINNGTSTMSTAEQTSFDQHLNNSNDNIKLNSGDSIEANQINDNTNNNNNGGSQEMEHEDSNNNEDSVDITISNVVTNFSVCCHLNLRQIATNGSNVVYRREQSIILMKLRQPLVTASIWSSGKITCTGATTEESAKCASRKVARCLQKLGFRVRFNSFRVVNVLGACRLPFGIKIHEFSNVHRRLASYEPELHPGATYRIKELKAVLKIFQTGSITITAPSVRNVQLAVEHIYPLVYEFRKPKPVTQEAIHSKTICTLNHIDNDEKDADALFDDKLIIDSENSSDDSDD